MTEFTDQRDKQSVRKPEAGTTLVKRKTGNESLFIRKSASAGETASVARNRWMASCERRNDYDTGGSLFPRTAREIVWKPARNPSNRISNRVVDSGKVNLVQETRISLTLLLRPSCKTNRCSFISYLRYLTVTFSLTRSFSPVTRT